MELQKGQCWTESEKLDLANSWFELQFNSAIFLLLYFRLLKIINIVLDFFNFQKNEKCYSLFLMSVCVMWKKNWQKKIKVKKEDGAAKTHHAFLYYCCRLHIKFWELDSFIIWKRRCHTMAVWTRVKGLRLRHCKCFETLFNWPRRTKSWVSPIKRVGRRVTEWRNALCYRWEYIADAESAGWNSRRKL